MLFGKQEENCKLMKIVILTGYYYPNMYPPSACIDKYVKELKKNHEVTIICQSSVNETLIYPDKDIKVEYVSNWWNSSRNYLVQKLKVNPDNTCYKFLHNLVRLYGVMITPFVYPTRLSWLIDAYYNKLKQLYKNNPFNIIISVSNPICSHLAAQKFKKYHPDIKWITYSTDPFTFYDTVYHGVLLKNKRYLKNFHTEETYYNSADYNILTEELYKKAITEFKVDSDRMKCFPYVLTPLSSNDRELLPKSNDVKILYAGALNKVIRNPEYALSILSKINDITSYFFQAGDCDSILEKYRSQSIVINGTVKRDDYLSLICNEADILLNIGNSVSLQAPSKMLELLSTGKPIINFYQNKDNQFYMIEKYPLGINIGSNEKDAAEKLSEFVKTVKGKRMTYDSVEECFPSNCMRNQLVILESLFH